MLFPRAVLEGIAAGRVTLAFRRWPKRLARPGGRQRTAIGVLVFDAVEIVAEDTIGAHEARQAGFDSRAALLAELNSRGGGDVFRIALRLVGPDPRLALRERGTLSGDEIEELQRRLARLDAASRRGPWTRPVLKSIRDRPAVRAADLAAALGRDTKSFKIDVRKLKELGLTESLEVGYRLSPRGRALLATRQWRASLGEPR